MMICFHLLIVHFIWCKKLAIYHVGINYIKECCKQVHFEKHTQENQGVLSHTQHEGGA